MNPIGAFEAELFRFNIKIIRSEFSKRRLAIFIGILPKYEGKTSDIFMNANLLTVKIIEMFMNTS